MKTRPHRALATAALLLLPALASAQSAAPAAVRAKNYGEALEFAKTTGRDIAVFQRGSDWSHLGEKLLADVWDRAEFAAAAGKVATLVVVDRPETPGGKPVEPGCPENAERSDTVPTLSPAQRLQAAADPAAAAPPCDIVQAGSAGGATLVRQDDGSVLASGNNPPNDTLTLTLKARTGGTLLRFDFPPHDSLPGRGPGRASNGNFAISEIELAGTDGKPLRAVAAWGSASEGHWPARKAIDGISDNIDNLWNAAAHQHVRRTLMLVLEKPVPAGASLTVRIISKTPWGQHVPGCIRAALLTAPALEAGIRTISEIEANEGFGWRGCTIPRVALMDGQGRPIASEDKPRLGLTPATLAARIQAMQGKRIRRDECWALAEKAAGAAKAELLWKGLEALDPGIAFDGAYNSVREQIKQADPKDESGILRRMQFQPDPRSTPPMVNEACKLAGEKKYEEALALLDRELRSPANRWLNHEQVQRIMIGKFHVYRRWPGHEEQRFDVQRDIHRLDPDTFWGLGAIGYLAMYNKLPEPVAVCYGFYAGQLKPGPNAWTLTLDTAKQFDHAGKYAFSIIHSGGRDTLKIRSVSVRAGGDLLASASPAAALAPGGKVETVLDLKGWTAGRKLAVRIELDAPDGKPDAAGRFEVEPLL